MVRFLQKFLNKVVGEKTLEDTILESTKQEVETQTTLLQKKAEPFTGVPAPVYLKDDEWFGPAPEYTEKQQEYRQQEAMERLHQEYREEKKTCESHDIHAKMYQIATKNWTTVAETQGGSENFQEGPDGWNSGTGINQFKR